MKELLETNILALMPCPLKAPLEKVISEKIKEVSKESGKKISYKILSNAVMQEDIFEEISKLDYIEDLPDVLLAPGIGRFFYQDFIKKFRDKGYFESVIKKHENKVFHQTKLYDPKDMYDLIGFNPLVFLVDKTRCKELPTPRKWADLVDPCYEGRIAFRGKDDRSFCEGVLFTIFQIGGKEMIQKLGKSVKCRLHPAEMVKMAGSSNQNAPDISVIPYSFAKMAKKSPYIEIICPEDGAAINPLVMLTKKDASDSVKEIARFIAGKETAHIYSQIGFYSESDVNEEMNEMNYSWCGWDFIYQNSIRELFQELNEIMFQVIQSKSIKNFESGCMECD